MVLSCFVSRLSSDAEVSRKRKQKNWEDEDYYDSDDDTFLDRTGTVERKRTERMKKAGKVDERPETYESLVKKKKIIISCHLCTRLKNITMFCSVPTLTFNSVYFLQPNITKLRICLRGLYDLYTYDIPDL